LASPVIDSFAALAAFALCTDDDVSPGWRMGSA
jgi:hypothetical protein